MDCVFSNISIHENWRWFEISSVHHITHDHYMLFFCSTISNFLFSTRGVYTATSIDNPGHELYTFPLRSHIHIHEHGLLSVVFLCGGNYHPVTLAITEQFLVHHSSAKLETLSTSASNSHCVKTVFYQPIWV